MNGIHDGCVNGPDGVIKIQPNHADFFSEILFEIFDRRNSSSSRLDIVVVVVVTIIVIAAAATAAAGKDPLEYGRVGIVVVIDPPGSDIGRPPAIVAL